MQATDQQARDELLTHAGEGRISADEAEAEAKRLGIGRLASRPDPQDFDPDREAFWDIPMAVAWIACRRKDAVREAWLAYCEECWDWKRCNYQPGPDGPIAIGWSLEQRRAPSLLRLTVGAAIDKTDGVNAQMSVKEAEEALWIALRTDCFRANGLRSSGLHGATSLGGRVEIPPLEWIELTPVEDHHGELRIRFGPLGNGYEKVLLPSAGVRGLWQIPREQRSQLPDLMPPDGDGYMPLFCAAQWIATQGGSFDFDPAQLEIWRQAYADLLAAIASEKVRVVGTRAEMREPIPGYVFAGIEVDYPYANATIEMIMSETLYLRSYPYEDEEHWRNGVDDALISRRRDNWKQLMVERGDIRERWAFAAVGTPKSGLPGRPTSKQLVTTEMERRFDAGEMSDSIVAESKYLSRWLTEQPIDVPRAKPKSIEASIRARYRELRAG